MKIIKQFVMTKQFLVLIFNFISIQTYSQIIGHVTDTNNKALAYVNIYIEGTYNGTTSNEDGNYILDIPLKENYTIVFKFLGFKTEKKNITVKTFPFELNTKMQEENISLKEVIIKTDVNPAYRIIKAAIANREKTLNSIHKFKADFYSRGLIKIKNLPQTILGQDVGNLDSGLDSTRSGIIYLSETFSKLDFKRPNNLKEKIIASKVSGDNKGFSFNTAMDVDFNFYNNTVELGNQIISPIADYAFNYYNYKLDGVFYDDKGHLINKITVIPKRSKDRVFAGAIYIVEDQWSIYALNLSLNGQQAQIPIADSISLTQTYGYTNKEKLWLLISQQIDFQYSIFGINGTGRFTGVYSNYNFNPIFDQYTFGPEILSVDKEANKKDSLYWDTLRPIPLTQEESEDYIAKDSLQIVRQSKKYMDSTDANSNQFKLTNFIFGYNYRNTYKKHSFNISGPLKGFNYNTVQGFYNLMQINFIKNYDQYREYLSIGSNIGYGLSDQTVRGILFARYKFNDINNQIIGISGGVTTEQFNRNAISPLINSISSLFFGNNYIKLYERHYFQVNFSREIVNGLDLYSRISYQRRTPLFNNSDYTTINQEDNKYTSNNPLDDNLYGISPFTEHYIALVNITARIQIGQRYFSYPGSKFKVQNEKNPTISLNYRKGFGASRAAYNFDHFQIRLNQAITTGNKGTFRYQLKGGHLFNANDIAIIDYHHFNGNQTHVATSNSYLNVFNNLPYYKLSTSKTYLELHAEHDFKGYILNKIPLFRKLNFNLIFGAHILATPDCQSYREYSIGIDNIGFKKFRFLRLDYLRSYQNGFQNDALIFGLKFLNFIK